MAARLNPRHDAATRDKIKTTQLLNRLQSFALYEPDPQTGKPIEMTKERVAAALGLLRKTMPDLAVTQHTGDPTNPVQTSLTVTFRGTDK